MPLSTAVDNLYLFDPEFEAGADRVLSEWGGSSAKQPLLCRDDVAKAMSMYSLVKSLVVDTHGSPGKVYFRKDAFSCDGQDFGQIKKLPQFLREDARVLFLGCNIGEGTEGDGFLDDVGKHFLLGKGGFVGASTVKTIVWQAGPLASESYLEPFSSGLLKVRRYSAAGSRVGSRTVDRYGRER
jgi:hypothetical protein